MHILKNSKRIVNGIVAVLLLLLLSALTSVNAEQVGETILDCDTCSEMVVVQAGETFYDCGVCPKMIILPAGKFTMGSPEGEVGRDDDEGPQRQVTITKPFAVSQYEVTLGQFIEFVLETQYKMGNCDRSTGIIRRYWYRPKHMHPDFIFEGSNQNSNQPVVCVSWYDAQAYVKWLSAITGKNYRLLSESEWEYAARAGTTTAYHFGATISQAQAKFGDHLGDTAQVGSYPANTFGLYDMHGNVFEWVEDCWQDHYTGAPTDGSAWTSECDGERVYRGGAWYSGSSGAGGSLGNPEAGWQLRSADRDGRDPTDRSHGVGIRVARDLNPINP